MGLVERVLQGRVMARAERSVTSIDGYLDALNEFVYNGNAYGLGGVQQTMNGSPIETISSSVTAYAAQAFACNPVVFACMAVRQLVFSAVRFQYQQMRRGRPGDLFGDASLAILERPWPGGTTQDLLSRMIQDADLAGNSYWTVVDGEMVRLRPDWVDIVLEPRPFRGGVLGYRKVGYVYTEGGYETGSNPVPLLPDEVAHFAPYPDPLATYRGMSWLTPLLREIANDSAMSDHKGRFLSNAATPNLVVKLDPSITPEVFERFKAKMDAEHRGHHNAYKTLYLGGGADVTVVGKDFKELDFKNVQGMGETRIAAAAGVHPVIVGLSEGLQGSALNAGNYGQARRRFADGTMHPLWADAAGTLEPLLPVPPGARTWYDARDVPFLREDRRDAAEIQFRKAATIRQLVDAGYEPETVVAAVDAEDMTLLVHSGLYSVQLQPPGTEAPAAGGELSDEPSEDDEEGTAP